MNVLSPKSVALPLDAIVKKSIVLFAPGVPDPQPTYHESFERIPWMSSCEVESPKSTAFPVDAIVTYSMTFVAPGPGYPPPNKDHEFVMHMQQHA